MSCRERQIENCERRFMGREKPADLITSHPATRF